MTFLATAAGALAIGAAADGVGGDRGDVRRRPRIDVHTRGGLAFAVVDESYTDPATGPVSMRTLAGARVLKTYDRPTPRVDLGPSMSSIGEFPPPGAAPSGP